MSEITPKIFDDPVERGEHQEESQETAIDAESGVTRDFVDLAFEIGAEHPSIIIDVRQIYTLFQGTISMITAESGTGTVNVEMLLSVTSAALDVRGLK